MALNKLHIIPQYTRKLLHLHYIKCCGKDVSIFLIIDLTSIRATNIVMMFRKSQVIKSIHDMMLEFSIKPFYLGGCMIKIYSYGKIRKASYAAVINPIGYTQCKRA